MVEQVVPHDWFSDEKKYSRSFTIIKEEDCPAFVKNATANIIQLILDSEQIHWKWIPNDSYSQMSEWDSFNNFYSSSLRSTCSKSTNMKMSKHFSSQIKMQTDLTLIHGWLMLWKYETEPNKIQHSIPDVIRWMKEHGTCQNSLHWHLNSPRY